ncbi:MAG: NAD(P)H-binding protein [Bacteroidia bacterium]
METKTAIVIGATGLVGNELLNLLLNDTRFDRIVVFARRPTGYSNPRLKEHVIDFDKPKEWAHLVKGDVLFSALGTTIKQAGNKDNQYKIDYTYQYNFAEAASNNGVPVYVLVSSAGADVMSSVFYSRMKGELERDVQRLKFDSIYFIQPSLLAGERKKSRAGEKIGFVVLNVINKFGLLKKYKPVPGTTVAKAMINCSFIAQKDAHAITLDKVFEVAGI